MTVLSTASGIIESGASRRVQSSAVSPSHRAGKSSQLPRRRICCRTSAPGAAVSNQEEWDDRQPSSVSETAAPHEENGSTSSEPEQAKNAFQRFWSNYNKLLKKKPIFVKSMTSLVGFFLGDALSQLIAGTPYNVLRTLRMTLFGIVMDGPVGHVWYTQLDKRCYPDKPQAKRAIISKTALDQLVWAPIFTCVFFTFMCCLEGRPHYILPSIKKKLVGVLLANYTIWPLAHLINFKFIPSSQRILYINACQRQDVTSLYHMVSTTVKAERWCGARISPTAKQALEISYGWISHLSIER